MLRSVIAASYSCSIFNFLRNLHAVFHSSCTSLYSRQQYTKAPFSPHPCPPTFFIPRLFDNSYSAGVTCYLIVVLTCVSFMISDVEHIFMYLLAICVSSLEKCLLRSSVHFKIHSYFLLLSCMNHLWILDITSPGMWFANIFSHSIGFFFIL